MSSISKFYLHTGADAYPHIFQPTNDVTSSLSTAAPAEYAEYSQYHRRMDASKGLAQVSAGVASATSETAWQQHGRFFSPPIAAQELTGTVQYVGAIGHNLTTGLTVFGASLGVWLWRPTTGEYWVLYDGPAAAAREWDSSLVTAGEIAGTGASRTMTSRTAKDGDVIIVEVGVQFTCSASRTLTSYYDGTTEGSSSNNAAYILFGNAITLYDGDATVSDRFTGTSGTALAAHSPEIGGSWTDSTAGWQLDGAGRIQATAANCCSIISAAADGMIDVRGCGFVTSGEMRVIFRYSDSDNYWYVSWIWNGNVTLYKVVAGTPTQVDQDTYSVDSAELSEAVSIRVEMVGNTIRVTKFNTLTQSALPYTTSQYLTVSAIDSFNATATIIGLQSVDNSTSNKIGGMDFSPVAFDSSSTFLMVNCPSAFSVTRYVLSPDYTLPWQVALTLPAAAFRANKSYVVIAHVLGRSTTLPACTCARLVYGTTPTQFTGAFSIWANPAYAANRGTRCDFMVKYDTGATPADVTLQMCGMGGTNATPAHIELIAICLDDLGAEGTAWKWNENTTEADIIDSETEPRYTDGASLTVTGDGSTPWLFLAQGSFVMNAVLTGSSYDMWATIRDSTRLDSYSRPLGLCVGSKYCVTNYENNITYTTHGQATMMHAVVEIPTAESHTIAWCACQNTTAWRHNSSRLLALNLGELTDVAYDINGPGVDVSSNGSWVNFATVSKNPSANRRMFVVASASMSYNDDGTWLRPTENTNAVRQRLQVDADGEGLLSYPPYGDVYGAESVASFNPPQLVMYVLDVATGAAREFNYDLYGNAVVDYDAAYMALFRGPDPPPESISVYMLGFA